MDTGKYFDKIWCLSCLDKQRLQTSKQTFQKYGLDVEYYYNPTNPIIHACQKIQFETNYYTRCAIKFGYDTVYDKVASCFVGHYNIIKASYELGYDKVLIFEDDIRFIDNLDLDKIFSQMPDDWDVLNFYSCGHGQLPDDYNNFDMFWKHPDDVSSIYSNVMYAVNRKFMRWYLDNTKPQVADLFYKNIDPNYIQVYINNYNIVDNSTNESIIDSNLCLSCTRTYNSNFYSGIQYGEIADGVVALIIPKCACSSLSWIAAKRSGMLNELFGDVGDNTFEYHSLNTDENHAWPKLRKNVLRNDAGDAKVVAVYRDPIDRLISAKYTIDKKSTFEEYIKNVIATFKQCDMKDIDEHILPQSYLYDASKVDLFVNIKDLSQFLESIGQQDVFINKTPSSELNSYDRSILDKYISEIKEIYACDYNLIDSIPETKKFYKTNEANRK